MAVTDETVNTYRERFTSVSCIYVPVQEYSTKTKLNFGGRDLTLPRGTLCAYILKFVYTENDINDYSVHHKATGKEI